MRKKKEQKESIQKERKVPLKLQLMEEVTRLRKALDERQDKYNFAGTENTKTQLQQGRVSYLGRAEKRQILSTNDLIDFVQEIYNKGVNLIAIKNRDYGSWKNNDPFANFRRHGLMGFLVRIDDKIQRLISFAENGKLHVLDESATDTIIDAANYLAITAAFIYQGTANDNPKR